MKLCAVCKYNLSLFLAYPWIDVRDIVDQEIERVKPHPQKKYPSWKERIREGNRMAGDKGDLVQS